MLLIAVGALYVRQVERSIEQRMRQRLREAKAAGKLPPEIEPEAANLTDLGVLSPASDMCRIELAHLLVAWRFILIPLVLLGSVMVARLLKRHWSRGARLWSSMGRPSADPLFGQLCCH
jgi:hypothetical protein